MRRIALGLFLLAACACAPEKPDTSMPTIFIFAGSISGNAVTLDADVGDADGFGDLVSVTCMTTAGNHVGQARFNSNETASCDITLPAGNWTVIMSVTDKAGWTTSTTAPESI